ncbi:MAG: hypothetical protein AAFZ15_19000 [Bacteroidota bacterium]
MQYKIIFIDAPIVKAKSGGITYREIDGLAFSRNIEAAILEKQSEGYEFVDMYPITSPKVKEKMHSAAITTGMMLNFKK